MSSPTFFFNKFSKSSDRFEKCYATSLEVIHIWLNGPVTVLSVSYAAKDTENIGLMIHTINNSMFILTSNHYDYHDPEYPAPSSAT